jgi:hypothetical protein
MQKDNHSIEESGGIKVVSADLDLFTAAGLAANGDLDEAEAILTRTGTDTLTVDATELLARIAVQKGEWRRAEQLWTAVLEKEPGRISAQRALSRMRSPWLLYAAFRRLFYLCVLGLVGFLSVAGIVALFHFDQWDSPASVEPTTAPFSAPETVGSKPTLVQESARTAAIAAPEIGTVASTHTAQNWRAKISLPMPAVEPARAIDAGVVLKHPPPPLFAIPGCLVTTNATETRVCFEDGLFAYRAEFTESGRSQLEAAAQEAACHTNAFWIVVEGHADSDPMPPNSTYKDNYALGLYRAMVAVEVIKGATSVAGQDILGVSAGEIAPPFLENDYESKLRNRTVVVRLVPKMGATFGRGK